MGARTIVRNPAIAGSLAYLPRVPWHGGPAYYNALTSPRMFADPSVFPIGEFYLNLSSSADATAEAQYVNFGVQVTGGTDLALVRGAGMECLTGWNTGSSAPEYAGTPGVEHDGYTGSDEVDMNNGPTWPGSGGYNFQRTWMGHFPADGEIRFANYGKGLFYWETDLQAAAFENGGDSASNTGTSGNWPQHIAALDAYFRAGGRNPTGAMYSDAQTYLGLTAAQASGVEGYRLAIARHRFLQSVGPYNTGLKPIMGFVEVGHPYTDVGSGFITPAEVTSTCMAMVIEGAAGFIYFAHNFSGTYPAWDSGTAYTKGTNVTIGATKYCVYGTATTGLSPASDSGNWQVVVDGSAGLRSNVYVPGMTTTLAANKTFFQGLAPVLNTQSIAWTFNTSLNTMLKDDGGGYAYIFAMQKVAFTSGSYGLALPGGITGTVAQVVGESRNVNVVGGVITDTFAAYDSWHIYKVAI